ncbi:MAG: hypothetical protein HDT33_08475 [Clostridiales bacterium]|nr:hypothetical protein [Clostridiales bacterium]
METSAFATGTIRQVHRHLTDTGYHVSEYAIRRWVKLGIIPAAYSGSTAYVSVSNVRRILDNGTPALIAS